MLQTHHFFWGCPRFPRIMHAVHNSRDAPKLLPLQFTLCKLVYVFLNAIIDSLLEDLKNQRKSQ